MSVGDRERGSGDRHLGALSPHKRLRATRVGGPARRREPAGARASPNGRGLLRVERRVSLSRGRQHDRRARWFSCAGARRLAAHVWNAAGVPARCLIILTPPEFAQYFRELSLGLV